MTYGQLPVQKVRIGLCRYGKQIKSPAQLTRASGAVLDRLQQLTACELQACVLHFLEGHSQAQVAEWLGVSLRIVQRHITFAVLKVPELRPLRTKSLQKIRRPKIFQFSQLGSNERGPFSADEL